MYLCLKEKMLLYNWILVLLSLQSFEANPRKNIIESIECRLNICTKEIFKIHQYIDALNSSNTDVERVKRDVVLSKLIDVDNENDLCYTRGEIFRRIGLREEKKWARNQINNIQSDVTAQATNIDHLQNELTAVRSRTEALSAEIEVKLEALNNRVSNMSELRKQHNSYCQYQIDITGERINELHVQQLNATRDYQLTIDEAIANKDKELKTIVEQVESIETQLSHSLASKTKGLREEKKWARNRINNIQSDITTQAKNIDLFQSELTAVRSQTEAVGADIDIKIDRLNKTMYNMSDMQKQQNAHCQAQIDITGERIHELHAEQLNSSREFQLIIDEAIANKDNELKKIVEKVGSVEAKLSHSLASNTKSLREEKEWARNRISNIQSDLTTQAKNIDLFQSELTAVRSQTEAVAAEIDIKFERLNNTMSNMSDIQKKQKSHHQAQIDITVERIQEIHVQQLNASREFQLTINEAIANKDKELKRIVEKVESIETQLSQSHSSIENELTAVTSRTEELVAEMDSKLLEFNGSLSVISEIQKQQNSHFQAFFNNTGERLDELNVQQLTVSREVQSSIDQAIARKDKELKTIAHKVGSLETQVSQSQAGNIRNLQHELTTVRSETEAVAGEIYIKLERLYKTMSNMSDMQKQHNANCQAQIDITGERIHELHVQQLNASREFQLTINEAIANKDKELETIVENVGSIETQLSHSLASNRKGLREEKKWARNRISNIQSDLTTQANNIDLFQSELTVVRSQTEAVAAEIDINLERLNNIMSNISDIQNQQKSHHQAQIDITDERIHELHVQQLNASREFQLTINEALANKEKELKTIVEKVESIETQLSQSLSSNMKHIENELTAVKSRTGEVVAEMDSALLEFNGSLSVISEIQKQQDSHCQTFFDNTGEKLDELNVHQLKVSRDLQSSIDQAIARKDKELETIADKVWSLETQVSQSLASNITNLETELTTVRSLTEAVAGEIDIKLERLHNTMSNMLAIQKQDNAHCQAQIDITAKRIHDLYVQQLNASRECQLTINEAIANKDKELKTIAGEVESIETQFSQSLSSNIRHLQNELATVKTKTKEVASEIDFKILRFNGSISNMSDIQKQQHSYCLAQINDTDERLHKLNVHVLTDSREIRSTIDLTKASNEKEIKLIQENVRSVESQLSKSLGSNMEKMQKELSAVRSRTEAVSAELEKKAREIRSTIDVEKSSNEKVLKAIHEHVRSVESQLSKSLGRNMEDVQKEFSAVKYRIEAVSAALEEKAREIRSTIDVAKASNEKQLKVIYENVNSVETQLSMSLGRNMEDVQKNFSAVNSRTKAAFAEVEKTAREIRSTIDAAKASNEQELKVIRENVKSVETQVSKSLERNMEDVQNELSAVRSRTEAVSAELEKKAREIRSTIDVAKASNEKELKVIHENVRRVETQLSETYASTTNLKNDWTAFKSRIESVTSAIDSKIVTLSNTISNLSNNLKRLNSQYQAQEERLNKFSNTQLEASCPSGWTKFENECYFLYGYKATFGEAENMCGQNNSVVAEARSSTENTFLGSFERQVWLGISNKGRDGNWRVSSTGQQVPFFNWDDGQPEGKEDCAVLYTIYTTCVHVHSGSFAENPHNVTF